MTNTVSTGKELMERGISMAAMSAGYEWLDSAKEATLIVASLSPDGTFTTEDVRNLTAGDLDEPPNLKSWGAVMRSLAREGKIRRVGFVKARNKSVHCMHVTLWELVETGE